SICRSSRLRYLHSFPTRRSSDLADGQCLAWYHRCSPDRTGSGEGISRAGNGCRRVGSHSGETAAQGVLSVMGILQQSPDDPEMALQLERVLRVELPVCAYVISMQ